MTKTLAENVSDLAAQLQALSRKRHRDRVVTWALAVLALAVLFVGYRQITAAERTACQATNTTNAALLRLLEAAVAADPPSPAEGATPSQIKEFNERRDRTLAFLATSREELAPRRCG